MRSLYFDCFAGASGNMILGALAAAGVRPEALLAELSKLNLSGYEIEFSTVDRSGISATFANVQVPHERKHRHLSDIESVISRSEVLDAVKGRAIRIFRRLGEAEARIHGVPVEKIHFHEVGALDAIIDIVGACVGFQLLGIEKFYCSRIHVGSGFVEMAHGKFPIPPPAVTELLKGFPIYSTEIEGELMTPTGAAIISTVCERYEPFPDLETEVVAYGAGGRDYEGFPNALRILIGETAAAHSDIGADLLVLLETNIDDLAPHVLGHVMERALEIGALDCWLTPIQMKKNRPAVTLSVLCSKEARAGLTEMLYRETTTLGIRVREIVRECLAREVVTVSTEFGCVDVKLGIYNGETVNAMPEYEQVKRLAVEHGVPFRVVAEAAVAAMRSSKTAATNGTALTP